MGTTIIACSWRWPSRPCAVGKASRSPASSILPKAIPISSRSCSGWVSMCGQYKPAKNALMLGFLRRNNETAAHSAVAFALCLDGPLYQLCQQTLDNVANIDFRCLLCTVGQGTGVATNDIAT